MLLNLVASQSYLSHSQRVILSSLQGINRIKQGLLQDFSSIYILGLKMSIQMRCYLYFNDKVIKLNGNIKCLVKPKCILIRGHQVRRKCQEDISNVKCQLWLEHKPGILVSTEQCYVTNYFHYCSPNEKEIPKHRLRIFIGHRVTLAGISSTICLNNDKYQKIKQK